MANVNIAQSDKRDIKINLNLVDQLALILWLLIGSNAVLSPEASVCKWCSLIAQLELAITSKLHSKKQTKCFMHT